MKASDKQVAGTHYRNLSIQPSEFIQRNQLNWCEGNAIKYLCRHRNKNGRQDIEKAIHYLQLLIEWEYPDAPSRPSVAAPATDGVPAVECGLYRDHPPACETCEDE
jgi:hypothetical protein